MADDKVLVKFGADAEGVQVGAAEAESALLQAVKQMKEQIGGLQTQMAHGFKMNTEGIKKATEATDLLAKAGNRLKEAFGAAALMEAGRYAIETASEYQQLHITLESVMGSAEKGQQAFEWIKQFTLNAPMQIKDVTREFIMLKNVGIDPTAGAMQALVDTAAKYSGSAAGGITGGLQSLTLGFTQAWSYGKLQMQDMKQMVDAGVPVYDMLAKALGKTTQQIMAMASAGQLGRREMQKLYQVMEEDAKGSAKAQMASISGIFTNLEDSVNMEIDKLNSAGLFDPITTSIKGMIAIVPSIGAVFEDAYSTIHTVTSGISTALESLIGLFGKTAQSEITVGNVIRGALEVIRDGLIGVRETFTYLFDAGAAAFKGLAAYAEMFANVAKHAIHLDFTGAEAAWHSGMANIYTIEGNYLGKMVDSAKKAQLDILKFSSFYPSDVSTAPKGFSLGGDKLGAQNVSNQQITDAQQVAKVKAQIGLAEIARDESIARHKVAMGQMTQSQLAAHLEAYENRRYSIEKAALDAQIKLQEQSPLNAGKAKAMYQQLELLKQQHETKMLDISQKAQEKNAKDQKKAWDNAVKPMEQAFTRSFDGVIQGTQKVHVAIHNMLQSILLEYINASLKMLLHWTMDRMREVIVTETTETMKNSAVAAGSKQGLAIKAASAIKEIAADAAKTYSGVFAYLSPEMGPFAAIPAVAAAALVSAKSAAIPSAAGGYDIPAGVNPLTQLHQREMVLPAKYADMIRAATANGGQGGDVHHHHYTINAIDPRSFGQYLERNHDQLARGIRAIHRNGGPQTA